MRRNASSSSASSVTTDRQAADELGDQTEFEQIFGHELLQQPADLRFLLRLGHRAEAQRVRGDPALDDLLQTVERAAANEQHVGRVELNEFLVRMLAALRDCSARGAGKALTPTFMRGGDRLASAPIS
jgi:hypothetical protein